MMGSFKSIDHNTAPKIKIEDGMLKVNVQAGAVPEDHKWAQIYFEQMIAAIRDLDMHVEVNTPKLQDFPDPVINILPPEIKPVVTVNNQTVIDYGKAFMIAAFVAAPVWVVAFLEIYKWVIQ